MSILIHPMSASGIHPLIYFFRAAYLKKPKASLSKQTFQLLLFHKLLTFKFYTLKLQISQTIPSFNSKLLVLKCFSSSFSSYALCSPYNHKLDGIIFDAYHPITDPNNALSMQSFWRICAVYPISVSATALNLLSLAKTDLLRHAWHLMNHDGGYLMLFKFFNKSQV